MMHFNYLSLYSLLHVTPGGCSLWCTSTICPYSSCCTLRQETVAYDAVQLLVLIAHVARVTWSRRIKLSPFVCGCLLLKGEREIQSSGAVWQWRWAWALIPYPSIPQSLINHTNSVDVKHHERRRREREPHVLFKCTDWTDHFKPFKTHWVAWDSLFALEAWECYTRERAGAF